MTIFLLAIVIFLQLIFYIVVFDVVLSWLSLAWIRFRPQFMRDILDPMYGFVRKYIPSRFWAFDFTPIIIIFAATFLIHIISLISPEVSQILSQLAL
jgi:YggT family protein